MKKNLVRPLLPFGVSSLLLVVLLCALSQATEAESSVSSAATEQETNRFSSLDYQTGVSVCHQTRNLVPNPGFELGNGTPDHWHEYGPCLFSYDDPGPDSDVSALINASSLRDTDCVLYTSIEEIPVEPGRFYDYSAMIRANLAQGDAYLRITFWSWQQDHWKHEGSALTTRVTDTQWTWVQATGSVQAPADAEYARIYAVLPESSKGSVWFDDVFLGLSTCLGISKSDDPDPVSPGQLLTYTIVCSNAGREEARNVQVIETYSKYVDFDWAEPSPDHGNHTWVITRLVPGESRVITVWVEVEDDTEGNILVFNKVKTFSEETVDNPISRRISTNVGPDGPSICKIDLYPCDADKRGQPGYLTDYDVVLTNVGSCEGEAHVVATSSQGWTVTVKPHEQPYTLPSRGSVTVTVSLSVPERTPAGAVDRTLITAALTCGLPCNETVVLTTAVTTTVGVPLNRVDIDGPTIGTVNTTHTFTATVSPPSATHPIDFIWWPSPDTGQGSALVTYMWSTIGTKTITVTAINAGGTATDTHSISIERHKVYLPLALCCCPLIPPDLKTIENDDIDGSYTICWSHLCDVTFVLEEATDSAFTDATEIYSGAKACYHINDRSAGRYYYRVKAYDGRRCSIWSPTEDVGAWWEQENNDSRSDANGPLISCKDYHGRHDDVRDYFSVGELKKGDQINMKLSTDRKDVQLQLWAEWSGDTGICRDRDSPYDITCAVEKQGKYFICVKTESLWNTDTYILHATFP